MMRLLSVVLLALCLQRVAPADVHIDRSNRIPNRTGSQCVYASLETLGRHHGVRSLYSITSRYKSTSGPQQVERILSQLGVRHMSMPMGSQSRSLPAAEEACRDGYGCLVGMRGRHAVVLVGLDMTSARIMRNSTRPLGDIQSIPRAAFDKVFDGWIVIIYPATRGRITLVPGDGK